MKDKQTEMKWDLESEFQRLNNAYVAGDEVLTLTNLGFDTSKMTSDQIQQEYYKIVLRIRSITNLLVTNYN